MEYKIQATTNGWIAQRDPRFNGKTEVTIEEGLTLKEAQKRLLDLFNEDYEKAYSNWGMVRCNHRNYSCSYADGTRSYEYDGRNYRIIREGEA